MKTFLNQIIFLILFLQINYYNSQTVFFPIKNCKSILFNGNVYVAGFQANKNICLYKLNSNLKIIDSVKVELKSNSQFTSIDSDTIHNSINLYLQGVNNSSVSVYCFDNNLKLTQSIIDIENTKINALSRFSHDFYYNQLNLFVIKKIADSSGFSFYLTKHSLKDKIKFNQYNKDWQFAFGRKSIESAKIIKVVNQIICCYVNVIDGKKKGQWLLQIDEISGRLKHANKLNTTNDDFYAYGNINYDSTNSSFVLIGQKFNSNQFNPSKNLLAIKNVSVLTMYFNCVDTAGNVNDALAFKLPVNDIKLMKAGVKKVENSYLFNVSNFTGSLEYGKYNFDINLFKNDNNGKQFNYCNTINKEISFETAYTIDKQKLSTNLEIEKFYFNSDNSDLTGVIAYDSVKVFANWFYKKIPDVKFYFDKDELGKPFWVLKKLDLKTNAIQLSKISFIEKNYKTTNLLNTTELKDAFWFNKQLITLIESNNSVKLEVIK